MRLMKPASVLLCPVDTGFLFISNTVALVPSLLSQLWASGDTFCSGLGFLWASKVKRQALPELLLCFIAMTFSVTGHLPTVELFHGYHSITLQRPCDLYIVLCTRSAKNNHPYHFTSISAQPGKYYLVKTWASDIQNLMRIQFHNL